MFLWPTDPWADEEWSLTAGLFLFVPAALAGLGGVEAGTDPPPEAALLAVVLCPWLEGRGLLVALRWLGPKLEAAVTPDTGLVLVFGPVVPLEVPWPKLAPGW